MADVYFDAINGLDAQAGTKTLPKQWAENYTASASDRLFFRRGQTQWIVSTAEKTIVTGTPTNPTYYGVWGESDVAYAIFRKAKGAPGTTILNASHRRDYIVEDIFFDLQDTNGSGSSYRSIYISATTSGNASGVRVRRCKFANSVGDIPGLYVGKENTTDSVSDVIVEDCELWNNGADGLTIMAGTGVIARRLVAWDNGTSGVNGGHNFRFTARQVSVSSGWTQVNGETGNIWSRGLSAHEIDVYFVRHPSYARMAKYTGLNPHTSTPLGGYAVGSGRLWVNAGATPNGSSMTYVWDAGNGNILEDCVGRRSRWNRAAPFQEGHGASFDDWASGNIIRRCVFLDSEGLGVSFNGGDNNLVESSIFAGSAMRGASLGSGVGNTIRTSVFVDNNQGDGASTSVIAGTPTSNDSTIRNNIIVADALDYGIYFDSATGCVAQGNLIYGATDDVFGGTETGTVDLDPRFLDRARPWLGLEADSPCRNAGAYMQGARDRFGRRYVERNIGPWARLGR